MDRFKMAKKREATKKIKGVQNLHKIIINNKRFGELDGAIVWLTEDLFKLFSDRKTRSGTLFIDLFKSGRAIRGFKHLLEQIKNQDKDAKLILTDGPTTKRGTQIFINYQDYIATGQSRFLSFYRATGLDVAQSYLHTNFPKDFDSPTITANQLAKIRRNLPEIIDKTTKTKRTQKELFEKTSQRVTELRTEENALKQNITELRSLLKQSSISYYQSKINELEDRLSLGRKYPETKGENSWQAWVYENNWILGVQYETPIQKTKVGFDHIPDFLFPTLDGFLDILEIKLPTHDVIVEDRTHPGSFVWSSEANKAIGQVVNYTHQIELNQLQLRDRINEQYERQLFTIKPRAFILIGQAGSDKKQKEALRKLNYSLHGIEVLTYTDLKQRANNLISLYTRKFE
jgi:hypothetical protein